jgi:signal transduction histidine kinase/HAMP domain-containing protein
MMSEVKIQSGIRQLDNEPSQREQPLQKEQERKGLHTHTVGIREKLIFIFLLVKVLPLILLAYIAWQALVMLGDTLRRTAVTDSRAALTAMAVENIERITTDTAHKVAAFLYQRDADISFLAKHSRNYFQDEETLRQDAESFFANFGEANTSPIRQHTDWVIGEKGMSWIQGDPYVPPEETKKRSGNLENEDRIDGAAFNYRPPFGFGDDMSRFASIPLYDEIALLDKHGRQIAKYVTPHSTKKRFPFPKELLDVSDPHNTFVKAERYVEKLPQLGKEGIYVSDVIGAYIPTRFIGMYTPDYIASRRVNAKILELEAEGNPQHAETIWQLQILRFQLSNDEIGFNSDASINQKIHSEIERRLGEGGVWKIENKSIDDAAATLRSLGFAELAEEILSIPHDPEKFDPTKEAFAGAENPLGVRFEGIVRWAKPVLDNNHEVIGYVTFALNHDHLLEMIDHITPMPKRYSELSDAFLGNYAFIWDYKCRSIVHPRHHSIYGYNPETGLPETPWLEKRLYDGMIAAGFDRADWQDYIATLEDYTPFLPTPDWVVALTKQKAESGEPWTPEEIARLPLDYQSRLKRPSPELTREGLVGLDGRYLNTAPQCTGWMNLTEDGGSGSFYILWSGLYKLTTAAAIPYYTGQYCPNFQGNHRGFGFVAVGAGVDYFSLPANEMGAILDVMVHENINKTSWHLVGTTAVLSIIVIFIAIWMASYLSRRLRILIDGIDKFHRGDRSFRFAANVQDEFGHLARSFDEMAESIVQSVHSPLVITDLNLKIIYVNVQALDALGGDKSENIVGRSYKEKSIYGYGSEYCPITALRRGKGQAKVLHLKQGDKFLLGTANYLVDANGVIQGYIITSNDVTDISRKQVELEQAREEAELASRHKSRFLARMSHELRTPMNAILGLNDITRSKISSVRGLDELKDVDGYLERLKHSSLDLLELLNSILDASNLESGSVALVEKPLDLSLFLQRIMAKAQQDCAQKHLELTPHFDTLTSSHFVTDEVRLQQVINNLLNNAIKFTPESGHIDFIVQQKDRNDGKSLLSFTVRDTGCGIAPEEIDRILYPLEQPEIEHMGNRGLGLVIVRRTLELFHTHLQIRSELGKGSEFSFDVWLQEKEGADEVKVENVAGRFTGQKALVVDDVRLNRVVLVNFLREAGFTVDEAEDGKEGLDMFDRSLENEYSIILMDIQMPVMDGYESAMAIRNLPRPDATTLPIITISANAFQEDIDKSIASGMNAHYAKPIQRDVVSEILMKFCEVSH